MPTEYRDLEHQERALRLKIKTLFQGARVTSGESMVLVSRRGGIACNTLRSIETGNRVPTLDLLPRLAIAYNIPMSRILSTLYTIA